MLGGIAKFLFFQQHKRRKHGTSTKVGTKSSESLKEVLESEELDKNNEQLQQELSACQHFFDNAEMENGRHRVFKFKLSKVDPGEINEKLKEMFEKLNCAAKINLSLGFFYEMLTQMNTETFMLMRTTPSLRSLIYFVLRET